MLSLPDDFLRQINALLDKKQYPENSKHFYRKWLRFYWDFCNKYHHDPFHQSSLPLFLKKLEQKGQSDQQRDQAHQAVLLFYQIKFRTHADSTNLQSESHQPLTKKPSQASDSVPKKTVNSGHSIHSSPDRSTPYQKPAQTFSNGTAQQKPSNEKKAGCSWVSVFDGLNREIQLRHYSPKTLKSYRGWTRRFQTFTKSKDPQALMQQDVVDFLSFLAVE